MKLLAILIVACAVVGCVRIYKVDLRDCQHVNVTVRADVPKEITVETEADIIPVP
jgi:hypothetical protein